jgi:type IV pilus assembly protein PilE
MAIDAGTRGKIKTFNTHQGWNLIELMVVLAIIGILATLIFPSLQDHIVKARRGDAQNELFKLKIKQEDYRLSHVSFATSSELPLPVSEYYEFSIVNVSATTFTLVALATEKQAADSRCQALALDQSMTRTPADCW